MGTLRLNLPEEASLCELHPYAKALKDDFKALMREDISLDEWKEREKAASTEVSDRAVISVATTRIDRKKERGAIVSEMITSSRINGRIFINSFFNSFNLWMASSKLEGKTNPRSTQQNIVLCCDENTIKLNLDAR